MPLVVTDYNYNILVSELIFKSFTRNVSHSFVSNISTLPDSDTPSADMTAHATEETRRPTLQKRISMLPNKQHFYSCSSRMLIIECRSNGGGR